MPHGEPWTFQWHFVELDRYDVTLGARTRRLGVPIQSSSARTERLSQSFHFTGTKLPAAVKSIPVAASAAIMERAACTVIQGRDPEAESDRHNRNLGMDR
jgi:hypothetical protein